MNIRNIGFPREGGKARDLISVFWSIADRLQTKLVSDHLSAVNPPADWISDGAEDPLGF